MREKRFAAVAARLQKVVARGDLSLVLDRAALLEAQRLAEIDGAGSDLQILGALGWLHWFRSQALSGDEGDRELAAAIRMLTPCFIANVGDQPEPLLPALADKAVPEAGSLLEMIRETPQRALVTSVADLWERILRATPDDHPGRAGRLSCAGIALHTRFVVTGARADLDAAIEAGRAAIDIAPAGAPIRATLMANLDVSLRARFGLTQAIADLDAAIRNNRATITAAPAGHPERAVMMMNLGAALQERFQRTGALADLDAAIQASQAAVDATPAGHPERAATLSDLGYLLRTRFNRTGAVADLDAAIRAGQAAVDASPAGHPERPVMMVNLGAALQDRFTRTGVLADLDAAITHTRAALAVTSADNPLRAGRLADLGTALGQRFRRTGVPADLDAAIASCQAAVDTAPAGHPDRAAMLSSLGVVLASRFEWSGSLADLDAAIASCQAAVDTAPVGHPSRAMYLSNLGNALRDRVARTGSLADLDAAIASCQAVVDATPAGHPSRGMYLSSLGGLRQERYERVGSLADLDAAIVSCQAAVDATPPGQPSRAICLSNLGGAQQIRFRRAGLPADLDAAIVSCQAAVNATPVGHPGRAMCLTNLGNALRDRSGLSGSAADLDAAIRAHRAAVDAVPADHPGRAMYLSNLGIALRDRSGLSGSAADLDAAIRAHRAAVDAVPADHPGRAMYLTNLGIDLRDRSGRSRSAADRDEALAVFATAADLSLAAPTVRVQAGRLAAALAAPSAPGQAADLLEAAIRLLPEVAPRQVARSDQQHAIAAFTGLAGDAAALALADTTATSGDRAARALRLLEAGQAVLLSQALDTRSDLTDLRQQHPVLARQFTELRDMLDQPSSVSPSSAAPGSTARSGPAADRHQLASEFAQILEQIRALDGFASFGLPPAAKDLLAQAADGPIVTFSISDYRSDALLLTEETITALEVPRLARAAVLEQVRSFHQALGTATGPGASPQARKDAQSMLNAILEWLWDAAAAPILDALGYDTEPAAGAEWPRVWWVTGGLLGLLPLHAAGYHADGSHRTVMDRVVSSATPTIRALRYARQHDPAAAPGQALIVAMPVTPGLPGGGRLPNVAAEAAMLTARLPRHVLLTEPGSSGDDPAPDYIPTKARVLDYLPSCPIAHFACHGASDPGDPSQSMLLLHDHERDPLTVASLAPLYLDNAQLAYLSACRTAFTPATRLLDEAIHLTSAFQLAGFPHVIGTLWEISDDLAVEIAETFYTALSTGPGILDARNAARALHHAVRGARDNYPHAPSLWAGYLHAGA